MRTVQNTKGKTQTTAHIELCLPLYIESRVKLRKELTPRADETAHKESTRNILRCFFCIFVSQCPGYEGSTSVAKHESNTLHDRLNCE